MNVDPELALAIHDASSYVSVRERVESAVADRYARLADDLTRGRESYESAWAPLRVEFSDRVTSELGHCWIHSEYDVVVSAFHPGVSSWDGHVVAAKFDHGLAKKRRIVAHEIVLSQVFQLLRARHPKEQVADWPVWALHSNYPQLAPIETELRRRFRARTSFDEYLSSALPMLRELDQERLLRHG